MKKIKILVSVLLLTFAVPQLVSAVVIGQLVENVDLKINNSDGPLTKTPGYATFSWNAGSGFDFCTASGDTYWSGSKPTSGSATVWTGNEKTGVTTYQLTCGASSGKINSFTDSITVTFNTGALSLPTATLTASPTTIKIGESATLTLSSQNATSCLISNPEGKSYSLATDGKGGLQVWPVAPKQSSTYSATCYDSTGAENRAVVASVRVEVYSSAAPLPEPTPPNGDVYIPPQNDCLDLKTSLSYRMRDYGSSNNVYLLQDFLQSKGYLDQEPTGFFGLKTFAAVKSFQRANGISPIGYVGAGTRAKIKALTCAVPPANTLLQECPSQGIINKMPMVTYTTNTVSTQPVNTLPDYYILKGVRREVNDFDASWVKTNCTVPIQTVY